MRRLGGAGVGHAAKHNLVTQTSNPTNSLYRRGLIEDKIYRAVDDRDEVIQYDITPIYGGANSVPVRLEYSAYGNKGFELTGWLDTPAPAPRHPHGTRQFGRRTDAVARRRALAGVRHPPQAIQRLPLHRGNA